MAAGNGPLAVMADADILTAINATGQLSPGVSVATFSSTGGTHPYTFTWNGTPTQQDLNYVAEFLSTGSRLAWS